MTDSKFIDYYEVLNIEYGASIDEVKHAFRKLAKTYHPDVAENSSDIDFALVIEAYKVLSNPEEKEQYDREYEKVKMENRDSTTPVQTLHAHHHRQKLDEETNLPVIDKRRIEYSMSLKNILKSGLALNKKFRHDDYLREIGYDITIYLTPDEMESGAVAYIELPARSVCPVCMGRNRNCYLCEGLGYINLIENLKLEIPAGIPDDYIIEVPLRGLRVRRFTYFTMKKVRIRIKII